MEGEEIVPKNLCSAFFHPPCKVSHSCVIIISSVLICVPLPR